MCNTSLTNQHKAGFGELNCKKRNVEELSAYHLLKKVKLFLKYCDYLCIMVIDFYF